MNIHNLGIVLTVARLGENRVVLPCIKIDKVEISKHYTERCMRPVLVKDAMLGLGHSFAADAFEYRPDQPFVS